MKFLSEKIYHKLFEIGVLLKAIDSVIEIAVGFAFLFVSSQTISNIFFAILGGEAIEDPNGPIVSRLIHAFQGFTPEVQAFWAFIFLSHGLIKIFLVIGLWKEKLWAFPISAAAFGLFVVNQTYNIIMAPSVPLELLTVLDIVLIYLIVHEYRYKKKLLGASRVVK